LEYAFDSFRFILQHFRKIRSAMAIGPTSNRDWIAAQFSKGIEAEQALADDAKATAESPPDPDLGVLYHEIAAADARHRMIVETIATRYGHTPSRSAAGGIGETLGRLKGKVSELGTSPLQRLGRDLKAKANAIHWYTAWVQAFLTIGDAESARELTAVLAEEKAHRDALQESLNRMVTRGATGEEGGVK
jgi:hypothetical protein